MFQTTRGPWSLRELGRRLIANVSGLLLLAALATARQAVGACPDFRLATAPQYDAGYPTAMVIGDFNGDGSGDLALVRCCLASNLRILLNNSNGTFGTAVDLDVGQNPTDVAAADFNGDGALDLAVTKGSAVAPDFCDSWWTPLCDISNTNDVSVLLGHGDGSFASPVNFNAGSSPASVAVGDFNGDGASDLAVANLGSSSVSILLGDGHGAFATAVDFSAGAGAGSVTVGEFNGDGNRDLAVANSGSDSVSILLGNGNGTFGAAASFGTGTHPSSVSVADFNGDGTRDLAVANFWSNSVSILLGNGDGTFATAINYVMPPGTSMSGMGPPFVEVVDLNADNKIDLVIADSSNGDLSIALGNGDGTFAPAADYVAGAVPWCIVAGFLDEDASVDLAVGRFRDGDVMILLGNGDGTFDDYGVGDTAAVATGDFNGDGATDVVVPDGSSEVSIRLGNGTGKFPQGINYTVGQSPRSVAVNDFDRDGIRDLAVLNGGSGNVSILLGNGTAMFAQPVNYGTGGAEPYYFAVDDFNDDGKADLAVANYGSQNVSILLGVGDGTLASAVTVASFLNTSLWSIATGDFNGDGKRDLVVATTNPACCASSFGFAVLPGIGNGTFSSPITHDTGTRPSAIVVSDFNRDGKDDLAAANPDSVTVSIFSGNGDGTFGAAVDYGVWKRPRSLVADDFNGDGSPDLAVANTESNTVTLLVGDGSGTFARTTTYRVGKSPSFIAVADIDGDGNQDLLTAFSVLFNTCGLPAVGDANGDGEITVTDLFHLINSLFAGGTPATSISDSNGDTRVDAADLFYLVNFLFAGGPR